MYTITFLLLNFYLPFVLAQQICYYPDGTEATDHAPCNNSASNTFINASSCCHYSSDSYCQDNNLCTSGGMMYRGACTDKTWTSPNCPQNCIEAQRNTSMNIYPCHAAGVWECEYSSTCCSNFTLPAFRILLRDSQLPGKNQGIGLADPNASRTLAASASVAVTAGTPPASSSTQTVVPKSKSLDAVAVGLAVGIPLGILSLASLALLLRQRKVKKEKWECRDEKKSWGSKRRSSGTHNPAELDEFRAVPELSDSDKNSARELGESSTPGLSRNDAPAIIWCLLLAWYLPSP